MMWTRQKLSTTNLPLLSKGPKQFMDPICETHA